jgi:hypothetical protein
MNLVGWQDCAAIRRFGAAFLNHFPISQYAAIKAWKKKYCRLSFDAV